MPDARPARDSAPNAPARVLWRIGSFAITPRLLRWILLGVLGLGVLAWLGRSIEIETIHEQAERLPGWAGFLLLVSLPLVGFPVTILHVAAGVRFGLWEGIALVAAAKLIQQTLAWGLVKLTPSTFEPRLRKWRTRFPEDSHRSVTVLCCLLPGMPYTVQLYLLPLIGVPLRVIIGIGVTLHTLRAIISIAGGDLSDNITPGKIAGLAVYYVVIALLCWQALYRVRHLLRPAPEDTSGKLDFDPAR